MANINNFVIDHVIRGIMFSTADGSYMWSVNQISDPTLSVTADTAQAVDAMGTPIATFNRGKQAEFSASNSLFDLGLYAAQQGNDKLVASDDETFVAPTFEEWKYNGSSTYTLNKEPVSASEPLRYVYLLAGDGTVAKTYTRDDSANDENHFTYNDATNTVTLPTGLKTGDNLLFIYDYNCSKGSAVVGDAVHFPKAGRFIMEVLGTDTCDPTTLIHAYVEFPNAKLDANVDISFATDGTHPFTIQAQQNYCDGEKILFRVIIPNEE